MNRTIGVFAAIAAAVTFSGCQIPASGPQSTPTMTLSYKLPVLAPVEPDKQEQERDGIRISVAAYPYTTTQTVQRQYRSVPTLVVLNHQFPADVREIPAIQVRPRQVCFKVKIYNQLERVLRLAGTVVSFQVAGKTAAVDPKAHYDDFLNGIILPRQEAEYEIRGPDLATLPNNATIALFLYDIVTATDAAGNPTKRSNFEFYYTLSQQPKTDEVPLAVRRVYLNQNAAMLLRQREQAAPGQWVAMPGLGREMNMPGSSIPYP